jgi:hypothetical protein
MNDEDSKTASSPGPDQAAERVADERRPWVAPALERLDLRDAMSGLGAPLDSLALSS